MGSCSSRPDRQNLLPDKPVIQSKGYHVNYHWSQINSIKDRPLPALIKEGLDFSTRVEAVPVAGSVGVATVPSPLQSSCREWSCPGVEIDFAELGGLCRGHMISDMELTCPYSNMFSM